MSKPHIHSHSPSDAAHAHGRNAGRRDFDPGFSFLRSSLGVRVVVVAACVAVLWAAVFVVIA
ncbi:MAG: hypothetical protein AB1698_12215 [Pseudomonadota bacterium]